MTAVTPPTPENVADMLTSGDNDFHDGNHWIPSLRAKGNVIEIGIEPCTETGFALPEVHFRAIVVEAHDMPPTEDAVGTVRLKPNGRVLAVLWPSPPHPARWMVTDEWGSCGYELDETVADWPIVGAVPFSPAAGFQLAPLAADASNGGAR